ncbi:MAG: nfdA 1 [Acidobacteria bacterium]|nr:nfdA 1 [Acidobacteriota bacterium]
MRNALVLTAAFLFASSLTAQQAPDLIVLRGRVFTADPAKKWAEAVAIKGDRIVAVGTNDEVAALANDTTRRIDAGGRVVIPGINDAHTHLPFQPAGMQLSNEPTATWDEVRAAIAGAADETAGDLWIRGNIGPAILNDPKVNAAALDKAAPRRKIALMSFTGHGLILSSAALDALRIRDSVADPVGGWYGRDADKHLDGKMYEYAEYNTLRRLGDLASDDEAADGFRTYADEALQYGITSIQTMASVPMKRLEKMARHTSVPLRVRMIRFAGSEPGGREKNEGRDLPKSDRERPLATLSGTKWILDGTPIEQGAALRSPYKGTEGSGKLNFPPDDITAMLRESLDTNDQLLLHVAGDRSAAAALDMMKGIPNVDWKAKRVRFEHGDGLLPDLIPTAAALGVVVVLNPSHLMAIDTYPAGAYMPFRSLAAANIPLALGSDGPMNPYLNIMLASSHPRPQESLTREQAVEAYTRGSAFAELAENDKGTLTPGKLADLAILSQDIFRASSSQLPETRSVLTIVGGKIAFDAGVVQTIASGPPPRR